MNVVSVRSLWVIGFSSLAGLTALSLGGCSEGTVRKLQEADSQNCQDMGLDPGTRRYADCMRTGSARYASQHAFGDGGDRHDRDGWNDRPSRRNNTCSAPPSVPTGSCSGCQVSCGDGQAVCQQGDESPIPPTCMHPASCECH